MYITILMLIMIVLISLFVGGLIGYALCYRWFTKSLKDYDIFG